MSYKKCYESMDTGECCCNCKNQIELFRHPSNNSPYKGSVLESAKLYACIVSFNLENKQEGVISENVHGICELHQPKK